MPNGQPGDLYIKIHVEGHQTIKRDGTSLFTTLPVKLTDAMLGSDYSVETLDGPVQIKIPAGITHGELLRIKEKGYQRNVGAATLWSKSILRFRKSYPVKHRN